MRILHIAPSFARRDGGPSEVLRGLIPQLSAMGHDVVTITTDKGLQGADVDFARTNSVRVVKSRRPVSWNFAPGLIAAVWKYSRRADVAHIHSVNTFTTTVSMMVLAIRRIPFVVEPHGAFDSYHMGQGRLKKRLYNTIVDGLGFRAASGVVVSSDREAVDARSILRLPVFMMPLGVDERLFRVSGSDRRAAELLFLGRVTAKKRLDLLIRAVAATSQARSPLHLNVAGPMDPGLSYDPVELAANLGISDRVHFLGEVSAADREMLLAGASIFVLPSEDESFGVAVAEAMAAGCAVIATPHVGIALSAAKSDALTLAELDVASLAEAIHHWIAEPDDAKRVGAKARDYASNNFRWGLAATRAVAAYEAVRR